MCTASWLFADHSYQLWFNRDERLTRSLAKPPETRLSEGTICLLPIDPDGGGSWLGCNEYGLSLAILNHYSAQQSPLSGKRSRGLFLTDHLHHHSQQTLLSTLEQTPLGDFAPFLLLILAPNAPPTLLIWDAVRKTFSTPTCPLTTSSWESEGTFTHRQGRFNTLAAKDPTPEESHFAFHHDHDLTSPRMGALMRREDARTVSLTHLQVSPTACTMQYSDVSDTQPPRVEAPTTATLPRQQTHQG